MFNIKKIFKSYVAMRDKRDYYDHLTKKWGEEIKTFIDTLPDDNYTVEGIKAIYRPDATRKTFDKEALLQDHPELTQLINQYTYEKPCVYFNVK